MVAAAAHQQVADYGEQEPRWKAGQHPVSGDRGSDGQDEWDDKDCGENSHDCTLETVDDILSAWNGQMGTTLGSAGSVVAMAVPKDGPERLIHFVNQRLADLGLTQEELAARGGPDRSTLGKLRSRPEQKTLTVAKLLSYDDTLGWERGSAAATLLGGTPQEAAAQPTAAPLAAADKVARIVRQAHRHADKLVTHLEAAAAEGEHLRRHLQVLRDST